MKATRKDIDWSQYTNLQILLCLFCLTLSANARKSVFKGLLKSTGICNYITFLDVNIFSSSIIDPSKKEVGAKLITTS